MPSRATFGAYGTLGSHMSVLADRAFCQVCRSRCVGILAFREQVEMAAQNFHPDCIKVAPEVLDFYDHLPTKCARLIVGRA